MLSNSRNRTTTPVIVRPVQSRPFDVDGMGRESAIDCMGDMVFSPKLFVSAFLPACLYVERTAADSTSVARFFVPSDVGWRESNSVRHLPYVVLTLKPG